MARHYSHGVRFGSIGQQGPTLQLANGKTATFMTQYDTKNSPIHNRPRDMGQRITGLAEGAIESMHNLPVSLAGSKLRMVLMAVKLLSMRFQSSQVVLMQKKQRFMKFRSIQVQWQQ